VILLSVDPGIRGTGLAVFSGDDHRLFEATYLESPCTRGSGAAEAGTMASWVRGWITYDPTELALEWPRIYASRIRAGDSPGDPNDLLALSGVDAALAALFWPAPATSYAPSDWKGQLTKEACHARIMTRLDSSEARIVSAATALAKSKAHNVLDAIGIGLHHLGRLARKRVIPA
jgi:hypothetical protein